MNGQANTDKPCLWHKAEYDVQGDKPDFMQWMETDATPTWIVYRISEYMVGIYQHCRNHCNVSQLPVFSKEQTGNCSWN
jgi:hypothetical protein